MHHRNLVGRDAALRRMTIAWPYSIAAILMLMVMLAMAALATLGVFASSANAQANGGKPPDVECAEAGGEFAGKFEGPAEEGTRPVNVGDVVMISFKISGDTVTFFSEVPDKFILVVKGGQLTEEFGPTRKGTFTLSNGQDIDHVTFCVAPQDAQDITTFLQSPVAAGGGGGASPFSVPQGSVPQGLADGGGPALLLPAAALLLGSGILTYAILRRG
jgi:hypothetical protein